MSELNNLFDEYRKVKVARKEGKQIGLVNGKPSELQKLKRRLDKDQRTSDKVFSLVEALTKNAQLTAEAAAEAAKTMAMRDEAFESMLRQLAEQKPDNRRPKSFKADINRNEQGRAESFTVKVFY